MPVPTDTKLYQRVKAEADRIYLTPSAYKSGWIVKTYKERGGHYRQEAKKAGPKTPNLTRWFKEQWVDLNRKITTKDGKTQYAPCGRKKAALKSTSADPYPLCRPSKHVNAKTPRTPEDLTTFIINKAKKEKQKALNKKIKI